MRFGLALIAAIVVGIGAFQLGVMQGATAIGQAAPAVAPYAYYWHPFFFPFGFLFPLFFLFLVFGLLRMAFGGGRHWGGHYEARQRMLEEWHTKAHGDKPSGTSS